jgi:hypothetical protein
MSVAVPLAIIALIALVWLLLMRRFQLSRWTVIVAIVVLALLLALFFRAEDEDDPESRSGALTLPPAGRVVRG